MYTVGNIIDAFGGNSAVSRILDKGPSTISEMRRRGRIDVAYWPTLVAAAPALQLGGPSKGEPFSLTYDTLVNVHVSRAAQKDVAA